MSSDTSPSYKAVSAWLFVTAGAIFLMAVIGAITRLTESGLSMTTWHPLSGAIPPLNHADWMKVFDHYKQSPQYKDINEGMSLAAFKKIFFWEWLHRLWGRTIGLIYALPLLFFWLRGKLPKGYGWAFIGILVLGGLQGLMGWYMVKSGLVNHPEVSQFRLAAHLMLAFLIYCLCLRLGFLIGIPTAENAAAYAPLRPLVWTALGLTVITMTWGAFTAGLRAGLIYNTFPMMGQHIWPSEILALHPWWRNFVQNHATVQFTHRVLAITTAVTVLTLFFRSRGFHMPPRTRRVFTFIGLMAIIQPCLGIATLLSHVDIVLATVHQAGAATLLGLLIRALHEVPPKDYSLARD